MKIGILVYPNCSMWNVTGIMELLLRGNKVQEYFFSRQKHKTIFNVDFVASKNNKLTTNYNYPISFHSTIYDETKYDLIFVPGFDYNPIETLKENRKVIQWIEKQYLNGAEIASSCTGSILLAASGILKNKKATTHWLMSDIFKELFPDIELCSDKILIDLGKIYMSGGATSFQNLILHIIEKKMSKTVALGVSKLFLIDFHKDGQNSYATMHTHKSHTDAEISKIQLFIEENTSQKFTIDQLANESCMSRRNLMRRFKDATKHTVWQYIQKLKVEKAKKMLENEDKTFEEIVLELGYEDVNSFRKIFVKFTGIRPSLYKKRYRKVLM